MLLDSKKIVTVMDFFPSTPHRRRRIATLDNAEWQTLNHDIKMCDEYNAYPIAAGSRYKVFETKNFGWVVFSPDAKTPDGQTPGRRIFKY